MCGPADYMALQTSLMHLTELCAAGTTTIVLHQAMRLLRERRTGAAMPAQKLLPVVLRETIRSKDEDKGAGA